MENASKALLIAGAVLIGVLLLTVLVIYFANVSGFSVSVNDAYAIQNVKKFNAQFEAFNKVDNTGKSNITQHDVVSVINLANNYNEKNGFDINSSYFINVIVGNKDYTKLLKDNKNADKMIADFLVENENKHYRMKMIEYSQINQKVKSITFQEI